MDQPPERRVGKLVYSKMPSGDLKGNTGRWQVLRTNQIRVFRKSHLREGGFLALPNYS